MSTWLAEAVLAVPVSGTVLPLHQQYQEEQDPAFDDPGQTWVAGVPRKEAGSQWEWAVQSWARHGEHRQTQGPGFRGPFAGQIWVGPLRYQVPRQPPAVPFPFVPSLPFPFPFPWPTFYPFGVHQPCQRHLHERGVRGLMQALSCQGQWAAAQNPMLGLPRDAAVVFRHSLQSLGCPRFPGRHCRVLTRERSIVAFLDRPSCGAWAVS